MDLLWLSIIDHGFPPDGEPVFFTHKPGDPRAISVGHWTRYPHGGKIRWILNGYAGHTVPETNNATHYCPIPKPETT